MRPPTDVIDDALPVTGLGGGIIEDPRGPITFEQLVAEGAALRRRVPRGGVVVVRARRARAVAAAFLGLDGWARRVDLCGPMEPPTDVVDATVVDDSIPEHAGGTHDELPTTDLPASERVPTRWRLFTSGTTGEPKPIDHTLSSLSRTVRRPQPGASPLRRWGLLYEPTRMAGVQVLLQTLASRGHLLDATGFPQVHERLRWLADAGVQALSATPTVWRQVLQSTDAGRLKLVQVTIGGEISDQRLLDALGRAFPRSRITHIFASTETGAAFAVNDRREGFPRSFLEDPPRGVRLKVRDGVLLVHAPDVSGADPDGFVSTGDLVEMSEDRVHFLGRASGVVNIGGVTVSPEQVESALRDQDEVADAVVTPRRNPFSGWILTANVVAADGVDTAELPGRLRSTLREQLSSAHVPASIKVVPDLNTSLTGKAARR